MRSADRTLGEVPSLAHLAPPVLSPAAALEEVVAVLSRDPGAGMAFVTDGDDRLLGVVPERALDADLMTIVLPPEALPAVLSLGPREALRAARGRALTAGELMVAARAVTPDTTLRDAVAAIWRAEQRSAPLVDAQGLLLGYVTVFEVLAALLRDTSGRSGR